MKFVSLNGSTVMAVTLSSAGRSSAAATVLGQRIAASIHQSAQIALRGRQDIVANLPA
jgi:hypothetical protein